MRSQGVFEYILLLGGVVLLVLIVISSLTSTATFTAKHLGKEVNTAYYKIRNAIMEINLTP